MKQTIKLVEKELKKLDSKIQAAKNNSRAAWLDCRFNNWGEYEKIKDDLSYRRLCLNHELKSLNKIQEGVQNELTI